MTDPGASAKRLADRLARTVYRVDEETTATLQLKYGLTFYRTRPFVRDEIEAVFDVFSDGYGDRIRRYRSTSPAGILTDIGPGELRAFRERELPDLYRRDDWGYGFDDGQEPGGILFLFHGFRPVSEPGLASFVRFEFPLETDHKELAAFSVEVAKRLDFSSGTCGLAALPHPFESETYDAAYAVCRRHYGVEAWNLDVTMHEIGDRAKSVAWITFLGAKLAAECEDLDRGLERAGIERLRWLNGIAIRSRPRPALIDRNRDEGFGPETEIYRLIRPSLMTTHSSFGGERWTDDDATAWLHRFSPDDPWVA